MRSTKLSPARTTMRESLDAVKNARDMFGKWPVTRAEYCRYVGSAARREPEWLSTSKPSLRQVERLQRLARVTPLAEVQVLIEPPK